jgi:predicted phosphodiesterase
MKISLLSDLHLEFSGNKFKHIWTPSDDDKEITLLLAGDIGVGLGARFFIENLSKSFKHVLFVCGNHEFYHNDMTDIRKRWREVEEGIPNFHFLDNDWRILDGIRFLGGTMWTSFNNGDVFATSAAHRTMNDFSTITKDRFGITPQTLIEEHDLFVKFLLTKFDEEFDGPTVVMTHHSPGNVQRSNYGQSIINYAYFAEIENIIGHHNKAKLWVHGHTHKSADYMINDTRVVCNPYGYRYLDTNPDFNHNLIIEA